METRLAMITGSHTNRAYWGRLSRYALTFRRAVSCGLRQPAPVAPNQLVCRIKLVVDDLAL